MKKVLITTRLLKSNEERISKLWDAKFNLNNEIYSEDKLIELSKDCDGILSSIVDKIDEKIINKLSNRVKIISNFAVGFGNIDIKAATKRNTDWAHNRYRSMYVVDGKNYPKEKNIIAKVLDISARATGLPPGYDIVVAHVDRNCKECSKDVNIKITPIAIANNLPLMDTKALHVVVPGNSQMNKGRFYVDHLLNGRIWGAQNTSCSRQTIKHDGKLNPPMLFDTSGSPVIFKECGKYVLHGLHGNGMGYKGYMYEFLQLLQTQKEWIQSEIYRWTGRTEMLDSCSPTGTRSFMPGNEFDVPQNGCNREQQKALYFEIYAGT